MFVSDLDAACAWYERVLGFRTTWRKSDYAALVRGSAMIHLGKSDPPIITAAFYVQVARGIDEYVAAIAATGEPILQPLQDHDYGMREATVQRVDKTQPFIFSGDETMDVGYDAGSPVTDDLPQDNAFTGKVEWVDVSIGQEDFDQFIDPQERLKIAMIRQ